MKTADFRQMQANAMLEEDLSQQVYALSQALGLLRYHTYRSQRSEPGFPDEVLVGRKVLYRELKRAGKNPTTAQQKWLDKLAATGADVGVWRPEDLVSGRIQREMRAIV